MNVHSVLHCRNMLLLFDVSAASVDHLIIVPIGLRDYIMQWFITKTLVSVRTDHFSSRFASVSCEVPQGFILGLLSFSFFLVNPQNKYLKNLSANQGLCRNSEFHMLKLFFLVRKRLCFALTSTCFYLYKPLTLYTHGQHDGSQKWSQKHLDWLQYR